MQIKITHKTGQMKTTLPKLACTYWNRINKKKGAIIYLDDKPITLEQLKALK